jgi:hypothetical protein
VSASVRAGIWWLSRATSEWVVVVVRIRVDVWEIAGVTRA